MGSIEEYKSKQHAINELVKNTTSEYLPTLQNIYTNLDRLENVINFRFPNEMVKDISYGIHYIKDKVALIIESEQHKVNNGNDNTN